MNKSNSQNSTIKSVPPTQERHRVPSVFLRAAAFLPAIAMMTAIFAFSAQPSAESGELSLGVSGEIVQLCDTVFTLGLDPIQIRQTAEAIEAVVRECAHFAEFALLGLTLLPALRLFCLGLLLTAWLIRKIRPFS